MASFDSWSWSVRKEKAHRFSFEKMSALKKDMDPMYFSFYTLESRFLNAHCQKQRASLGVKF